MISYFQLPMVHAPQRETAEYTPESLRTRVAAMDPGVAAGTAGHDAALILLAASWIGQNVDRLARFTGVRRDVVARCARRLVDNGVWQEGSTVSLWVDNPADAESFRADAAVAAGRLCRRIGENGEMEWAPQGYWRKQYDYVGPRGGEQPQTICYQPHVELGSQDLPYEEEAEEEEEPVEMTSAPRPVPRMVPDVAAEAPVWLGGESSVPSLGSPWRNDQEPAADLFPGAVWLG